MDPCPIWLGDIAEFDPRPWRGVVDCVTSGDPCQEFSVAGKGRGMDGDRWLGEHVMRIVEALRPHTFFRENVPGVADQQLGFFVPALERLGYRVAAGIFAASEAGASHRRERLFIMADASDPGLQGRERSGSPRGGHGPEASGPTPELRLPLFAPGPSDPIWADILRDAPHLEPAVRRVADGVANRVDRLRATGNGVVPLVAAYAWRTLEAALREAD